MPTIITRGGISAKGYGFGASSGSTRPNGFVDSIASSTYGIQITGATFDSSGNMYICGLVTTDSSFSGYPVVAKLQASTGLVQWCYTVSSTAITTNPWTITCYNDNIYFLYGTATLYKISTAGSVLETKTISWGTGGLGVLNSRSSQLKIDSSGNFYFFGTSTSSTGYAGGTVAKVSSSYSGIWRNIYWGFEHPFSYSTFSIGADGNISLCPYFQNSPTFVYSQTPFTVTGSTGTIVSGSNNEYPTGAYAGARTTDASGNIYTVIDTASGGSVAGTTIIKQNSSNVVQWQIANPIRLSNIQVELDSSGNLLLLGSNGDTFFHKISPSGTVIFQKRIASTGNLVTTAAYAASFNMLYASVCSFTSSPAISMALPALTGPANGTYSGCSITTSAFTYTTQTLSATTWTYNAESASLPTFSNTSPTWIAYTLPTVTSATLPPA
jgi:hypothetical protein